MSDSHLSRRQFVTVVSAAIGGIIGAVVGLPAIGYLISPAAGSQKTEAKVPLGPVNKVPVGVPTLFNFTRTKVNGWEKTVNTYGVFVLRDEENKITVLSNICTHLACRVNWDTETDQFHCPCHAAVFAKDGSVLNGPPPKPLIPIPAEVDADGNLFIIY